MKKLDDACHNRHKKKFYWLSLTSKERMGFLKKINVSDRELNRELNLRFRKKKISD
jgi:hypothetical protein